MVPQFCFDHWKNIEEPKFKIGKVQFNEEQFFHFVHS